jgi:hypothetical protein
LFFDVVKWALGFPIYNDETAIHEIEWDTLQKAIHGAKPKEGGNRMAHTGIKHSVFNKIRLGCQVDFFDQKPCVLIIPIMDLEEAKKWNGAGYNALVMCGSFEGTDASTACQRILMTKKERVALQEMEIEKARHLLEAVILGMAYSLLNCFVSTLSFLDNDSRDRFRELRNVFLIRTGVAKGVVVPKVRPVGIPDSQPVESLKVRVVEFSDHNEATGGHPAPDPLLLAVKAAINWSRLNYQALRAAGAPPEEEDELDVLAEEEYLEWRDNLHRPKTWDDLVCGLGQGGGGGGSMISGGSSGGPGVVS